MRAVVLADTHMRPGREPSLPPAAYPHLRRAQLILHAGDVLVPELLEHLADIAPTHAVLGNNDRDLVDELPEELRLDLDGVPVAMVHDAGPRKGRAARLHRRFPDARVVVFGHSHEPCDVIGVDGQRLFNPGSPTQRRRAPTHTLGVLEARDGELVGRRILPLTAAG